jgi:cytochrome P450
MAMPPKNLLFLGSAIVLLLYDRIRYNTFRGPFHLMHAAILCTLVQWAGWTLYYWMIYPRFVSPLRHIPGPKGGSLFMGQFFENFKNAPGKQLQTWLKEVPNDGVIRYLDIFNSERILPVTPAALSDVLVTRNYDFEKPAPLRKGISRILGLGLFLAEGEEHKRQRKTMMPAFNFRHVKNLYSTFWVMSRSFVNEINKHIQKTDFDSSKGIEVNEWASRATLDIIGVAGMGQNFGSLQDETNPLNVTYRKLFKPSRVGQFIGILNTFLPPWVIRNLPIQRNDDIKNASDTIKRTCFDLIQKKKIAMANGKAEKDILSVALESGGFSDEDLVNQMMTFLAAGHETTASALTWAIYMLCKHPDMQSKLREEVLTRLGPHLAADIPITSDLIDNSPYLQAFCQEVFRLYPPVSLTIRQAVVDTCIANIPIPKGTTIILAPWAINTSTALWGEDAQEFRPERWLESPSGGAESNFSFLTFLHGPRSCIGQRFAVAEFACLLAWWVGAFETKLAKEGEEVEIRGGITMKPKDGLWVRLKSVDQEEWSKT